MRGVRLKRERRSRSFVRRKQPPRHRNAPVEQTDWEQNPKQSCEANRR